MKGKREGGGKIDRREGKSRDGKTIKERNETNWKMKRTVKRSSHHRYFHSPVVSEEAGEVKGG